MKQVQMAKTPPQRAKLGGQYLALLPSRLATKSDARQTSGGADTSRRRRRKDCGNLAVWLKGKQRGLANANEQLMAELPDMWWTQGQTAMPPLPSGKSHTESFQRWQRPSKGGKGGGRGRTQANTRSSEEPAPHLPKRQRHRTDHNDEPHEIPAGRDDMSETGRSQGGQSWGKGSQRGRDLNWTSRKPPRRGGQGRYDKSAIRDVPHDPTHHHWMQMVTQGAHQALIQARKAGGQVFDTWICAANHTMAVNMMKMAEGHTERAMTLRQERDSARRETREVPAALPNPAADHIARFIIELQSHSLGDRSKEVLTDIWADIQKHVNLIEDVSYFNVSMVSEGEETRIVIGMKGWAMRKKLMDVMRQFGSQVRYSPGGAPPGYMERQLGEYCRELKEWEEY